MSRETRLAKRQRRVTETGTDELLTIAGLERSAAGLRRMTEAFKTGSPEGRREARKIFLESAKELSAAADELVKLLESE